MPYYFVEKYVLTVKETTRHLAYGKYSNTVNLHHAYGSLNISLRPFPFL